MKTMPKLSDKPLKSILKILFKEHKLKLIIISFLTLLAGFFSIVISFFFKQVIDNIVLPGVKYGYDYIHKDFIKILISMLAVYLIITLSTLIKAQMLTSLANNFEYKLRTKVFAHMEKISIKFFDNTKRGKLMSIYTNDIDTVRELITNVLPEIFMVFVSFVGIISLMITYSIYFTLIALCSLMFIAIFSKILTKKITKDFTTYQETIASKDAFVEEMMQGQKIIKLFNYEQIAIKRFNEYNDKLYKTSKRANYLANLSVPVLHNIGNILYVSIAISSLLFLFFNFKNFTTQGFMPLTIGTLVAFLALSRRFSNNFNQLAMQFKTIIMAHAGSKRITKLLDEPLEINEGLVELVKVKAKDELVETSENSNIFAWKYQENGSYNYRVLKGEIKLVNVSFGYDEKMILKNINITAKQGEKIALVGKTGAGKTTIANLLTRFYDVNEGSIFYDGFDIKMINKSSLRKAIGIVLQDISIFNDSVKNNILYGNLEASFDEVVKASRLANSDDFINRLPYGYETILENNGQNLSQGQRQLISIARTSIANPPVLILDEATSSIDTRTEFLVQKGLDNLIKNKTVFVIAHRLSTIRNANLIIVLDDGMIKEQGSHDELMALKGFYYKLYTGQVELD